MFPLPAYDAVIVTFNNAEIIGEVILALQRSQPPPERIIVYDSGSADDTCGVIERQFSQVTLIRGTNRGFGAGNNAAVRLATSEYVLFVNPDLKVAPDCARLLLESLVATPNLALINPLIYRGWDESTDDVYSFGSYIDRAGFAFSNVEVNEAAQTNGFSGACFLARRSLVQKFPFEERNFLYYEELDLTVNLLKAGYSIGKVREARCWHLENYSSPEKMGPGIAFRQFYAIQNRWFLLGLHWPVQLLLYALLMNSLHLAYFLLFFLRNGRWSYLRLAWVAPFRFLRGLRERNPLAAWGSGSRTWYRSLRSTSLREGAALKRAVLRPMQTAK